MEDAVRFIDAIGEGFAGFGGVAVVAQRKFGGAAETRERRAEIVGEVVEGFAEDADVGGVFVEEGVELCDEGGEFAAAAGAGHAGGEVTGFEDAAGGGGDGAERAGGAPREEDADGK